MKSFNHAFDGFGASWWPRLLSPLLKQPSLHRVETVALGVQMIDSHRVIRESGEDCGALQRPVLTSPLAIDLGVDGLCRVQTWDAKLGRRLFGGLWIVRYSSAVRSLILPRPVFGGGGHQLKFNSRKANDPWRGFQAHRSISQDQTSYDSEFSRWKAQYLPERDFQPLPNDVWENLVIQGGFFDEINREVLASGRKLILYALPTNPVLIDTFNRRNDYFHNSILLKDWAVHRGVVFVDLGIKDRADASEFYSDMRHLSGTGARIYSRELGNALVGATLNASTRVKETRVSH